MYSFRAIIVMLIFSAAVYYGMGMLGLTAAHSDPLMALAGAVVLLVALVINVWIYLKLAGEHPFKWFKE